MEPVSSENSKGFRPSNPRIKSGVRADYSRYIRKKKLTLLITSIVLILLVLGNLASGSSGMNLGEVVIALFGQADAYQVSIVWGIRMPHIACAVIGGIGLAIAGCAFQAVLGNPLASPSTIGVSQGAAFGASVAIIVLGAGAAATGHDAITFSNPYATIICAFVGGLVSAAIIMMLSSLRDLTPESIILAGVAISALFTGATAMVQYFAEDTQVASVIFWTFGSLRRCSWGDLAIMAVVVAASAVFFHVNRWNFNAIESGESSAHGLGVNVKRLRLAACLVATLCSASVIAFCGTINFIGLIAPHIMRRFVGSDYRYLLPCSALAGAVILLASDWLASSLVAGAVLPISAITSFVGGPILIYLLVRGMRH